MTIMLNDILKHHGVKGMKWGVRKDRKLTAKKALTLTLNILLSPKGNENHTPTTKTGKIADDILHTTMVAAGSRTAKKRIGDKRVISKGEKIAEKHFGKVIGNVNLMDVFIP